LLAGLMLLLTAGLAMRLRPAAPVERLARVMILLFMAQLGAGLMNLVLQAPIGMQLVHLLLADLLWISLVLLAASALAEGVPVGHWELGRSAAARHSQDGQDHGINRIGTEKNVGPVSCLSRHPVHPVNAGAAERPLAHPLRGYPPRPPGSPTPNLRRSATWKDYLALTKPRVISPLLFTTPTATVVAAGARNTPC